MRQQLEKIADQVSKRLADLPIGFEGDAEVGVGASGSATSRIDKIVEDTIIDFVRKEDLRLNILSEEIGFLDLGGDRMLVVDPLDGTANFNSEIPFFAVSLAIGTDRMSDVSYGLVRNLVNGESFYAEKGKGVWLNNEPIRTRAFVKETSLFLAYVGRDADNGTWEIANIPRRIRSLGCASLEMCHIARGMADGFYFNCKDFSKRMRIVDIAASALILREAGGEIYDLNGSLLDIKFNLDDRANFMALGDPSIKEMIL